MKKNIKIKLNDTQNLTIAIIKYNKIIYKEENTKVIIDIKNQIMQRSNEQYDILFVFNKNIKTKGYIHLKNENTKFDLIIETIDIIINNNYIKIIYKLNEQIFIYELEVL